MSRASPKMRDLAERLIASETRENKSFGAKPQANLLVGEKLPSHLATLLGNVAVSALLSRALALAKPEVPWLRAMHVNADGSFEGLHELGGVRGADEIAKGRVILLAQLLGLMVAFIGEELTLRLVRDVWPKMLLNNVDFGRGDKK